MTTTTKIPTPVLQTADHLIASIPFLLGFNPAHSVVLIWLRQGKVLLTQRVDVITHSDVRAVVDESLDELHVWAREVTSALRNVAADEVAIAVFMDSQHEHADWCDTLISVLCHSVIDRGVYPIGAWLVVEDQWRAFNFGQAKFHEAWQVLDPGIEADVAQDFASIGCSPVLHRSDLESEIGPDFDRQALVHEILQGDARLGVVGDDEERRNHVIDEVWLHLGHDDVPNEGIAMMARALTDVRIRDCVLWKLSSEPVDQARAARLRLLVRWVPVGKRAPIATVSAIYAWMLGDGARANVSLALAFEDEQDYELGRLLALALTNALPPSHWREMMSSLPYEAIRRGGAP